MDDIISFNDLFGVKKETSNFFKGVQYRLADNWFRFMKVDEFQKRPINYLEIGAFYGANLFSVLKTFASHPESKLTAIDPWIDYDQYSEYKGEQSKIYQTFLTNLANCGETHKITTVRDFSHNAIPSLPDNHFDIIYIDGNPEPEYVLEDAVLCFRKLKLGGFMIFDDYGWGGPDLTKRGIDGFLHGFHKRIRVLGMHETQVFLQKIK